MSKNNNNIKQCKEKGKEKDRVKGTRIEWHDLSTDTWKTLMLENESATTTLRELCLSLADTMNGGNSGINARLFIDGALTLTFYRCGSFIGNLRALAKERAKERASLQQVEYHICTKCKLNKPPSKIAAWCNTCYGNAFRKIYGIVKENTRDRAAKEKNAAKEAVERQAGKQVSEPYDPNDSVYVQCRKGWINRWLRENPNYDPRGTWTTWGEGHRSEWDNELLRGACAWGLTSLVERLLKDGRVDPHIRVNECLREAARKGYHAIVEKLIARGVRDTNGWAMYCAKRNKDQRMVYLLERADLGASLGAGASVGASVGLINYGIYGYMGIVKQQLYDSEEPDPVYVLK